MGIYIDKLKKMTNDELSEIARLCGAKEVHTTKWLYRHTFPDKIALGSAYETVFFRDFSINIIARGGIDEPDIKLGKEEAAQANRAYLKAMYTIMKEKHNLGNAYREDYLNFHKKRIGRRLENLQNKSKQQLGEVHKNVEEIFI